MRTILTAVTLLIGLFVGLSFDPPTGRAGSVAPQFLGNVGTTTVSSCGTGSPSVVGDNTKGVITAGGGVVTSCTLNFSHTLSVTPGCIVTPATPLSIPSLTITTSTVVIAASVSVSGAKLSYWCFDPTARF